MIHFVTVHFRTAIWIEIQLRYLQRFVTRLYRVHACFTGVDPEPHRGKFGIVQLSGVGSHAAKLNKLAEAVCADADPSDVIVFIDSDAFPIANIDYLVRDLRNAPLVAIRRDENVGDVQPHPSFCMTTVAFWREIDGDWGSDHPWTNAAGEIVTDTGGNLLKILNDRKVDWKPLLRTNKVDLHPLLFGIYDHSIYHHAAGSRRALTRYDLHRVRRENPEAAQEELDTAMDLAAEDNAHFSRTILAEIVADKNFVSRFGKRPRLPTGWRWLSAIGGSRKSSHGRSNA